MTPQARRSRSARRGRVSTWFRRDWVFPVALATFVGTSVWFGRAIKDFLAPAATSITVPALTGQTVEDALTTAEHVKLHGVVVERAASDRFPKDVVMRQDPPSGSEAREGRQISLVVSTGLQIFTMPDLRYESMREVDLDLAHYKLQLGKVKLVASDEVPANRVVAQNPLPLSAVRVGSVVDVDLAKGGPPSVKVPNFGGMNVAEARDAAARARVRLGQIVWTPFGSSGPSRGVV
ncbi:MAG TPA: PASTA domain-containing protein, partial [Candidatus Baltobacteraceae bacterium]|nr:PASTA domain-containing protein [Candidatus Baltobacteraceae bacterium]